MRRIPLSVVASTMVLSLAGCALLGKSEEGPKTRPTQVNEMTIGLLLPEKSSTRHDQFDYPIIKKTVASLTKDQGRTDYQNADQDPDVQAAQMQKMITEKVDVILLDAVDSHTIAPMVRKAKAADIPVIAYDRLAEGPVDLYVSFDNELAGEVQGRSLIDAMGRDTGTAANVVMVNGSLTDPSGQQVKKGALSEISNQAKIVKSYDTAGWNPDIAQTEMAEAINAIGKDNIDGVYSANDAMVAGIIRSFEAAGVTKLPPITGQDAELSAVQRIITGEQLMTVYKPYPDEAKVAATAAVLKVQGENIQFDALATDKVDSPTDKAIPTHLVRVDPLTRANIMDTVVADKIYTLEEICTAEYKSACAKIGLT
ncbi:substrate-binding domain-containing protein [Streptomyces sp. BH-SS-21]|uniref:Substrate-binding domain-containing protein n=1 Tax=Streptomyces liliiviolaceus TaxID=2823109 RepID=A0A940YAC3_9ACTN|nr:substrate-binding domain-containing protein [Streptomyces liliiviolaceus]MBQ0855525.1 substrate-binding domain-containing protein [Streptomyces liliiviolaceus]